MELYDLDEFLRLTATLNLQLCAASVGRANVLAAIMGGKPLTEREREVLLQALEHLNRALGASARRLGHASILHPLCCAALLVRALERPGLLEVLTALLHDVLEDVRPANFTPARWKELEAGFAALRKSVDPTDEYYLMERLDALTRRTDETYCGYIGRLLDRPRITPELARVKVADRLANVLDMRVAVEDPLHGVDCYETIFRVLFVNAFSGYRPGAPHLPPGPINGSDRLYQLYKTAVVLSQIRRKGIAADDPATVILMRALAIAGLREAQRILLHVWGYHWTDIVLQRQLVLETMEYVQQGGTARVSRPCPGRRLDGLFLSVFDHADRSVREERLATLYADKPLMCASALAFMTIFDSFIVDPTYVVQGISDQGVSADG